MRLAGLPIAGLMLVGLAFLPRHVVAVEAHSATLEVEVVDKAGKAVADAVVRVYRGLNEEGDDRLVITDRAGACRIPRATSAGLNVLMLSASDATGERQGYLQMNQVELNEIDEPLHVILKPSRQVTVRVIDRAGAGVKDALVGLLQRLGGQTISHGKTGADGWIRLWFPADVEVETVIALKSGVGYDNWMAEADPTRAGPGPQNVTLTLSGAQTVRVLAVDMAGKPVPGIPVLPSFIVKPGRPLQSLGFCRPAFTFTDERGVAAIDWLPIDFNQNLVINSHSGTKYFCLEAPNILADNVDPGTSRDVTMPLLRLTKISGRVTGMDGKPAAGTSIQAQGASSPKIGHRHGASARTTADGTYEINACPGFAYIVSVADEDWAASSRIPVIVRDDRPVDGIDFQLIKGTVIRGTVTVGNDERPAASRPISLTQHGGLFPQELMKSEESVPTRYRLLLRRSTITDARGRYHFRVGPGDYTLTTANGPKTPFDKTMDLTISDEPEVVNDFHIPDDTKVLSGVVVGPDGEPIQDAVVRVVYAQSDRRIGRESSSDAEGKFRFERNASPLWLLASSLDGALAARARVGAEEDTVTIRLDPAASVVGRLVDDGAPVAGAEVALRLHFPVEPGPNGRPVNAVIPAGTVSTAADGRFALRGLIVGETYHMTVGKVGQRGGAPPTAIVANGPHDINVGFVNLPAPSRLVATEQGIRVSQIDYEKLAAIRFKGGANLARRIADSSGDARRAYQRVLVVLGDPASLATLLIFKALDGHDTPPELTRLLGDFQPMYVTITDEAAVAILAKACQVDAVKLSAPTLILLGDDGVAVAKQPMPAAGVPRQLDVEVLSGFLRRHALPERNAEEMVRAAARRARDEKKHVLLVQSGPRSHSSDLLFRFIDQHRDIFDCEYVYLNIDASRSTRGDEVIGQFRKKRGGIPWMAVLSADGITLADSDSPSGNIAFPLEPGEINYFIDKMLKPTAQRLTPKEFDELRSSLAGK